MSWRPTPPKNPLQKKVACPHCFHEFRPEESLWIAEHPQLLNDRRLGEDEPQRFLPTRFTIRGEALDDLGFRCNELACPNCHLRFPRILLEFDSVFWSILGEAGSGKTCFLVSMFQALRTTLPQIFQLDFDHADMEFNITLRANVEKLFKSGDPSKVVFLDKTEDQFVAEFYKTSTFGDEQITYLTPFTFSFKPRRDHAITSRHMSHVLCLYDNAGEHFRPGSASPLAQVTHHLGHSEILLFLFDPTQDSVFRDVCQREAVPNARDLDPPPESVPMRLTPDIKTLDPQLTTNARTTTQIDILTEAAERIRIRRGLRASQQLPCRLMVIVTKFDAWKHIFPHELKTPWRYSKTQEATAFDVRYVTSISRDIRKLLLQHSPEIVTVAESMADDVYFLPTSASGSPPEHLAASDSAEDPAADAEADLEAGGQNSRLGFRPMNVKPVWVEVPMLLALHHGLDGLIPTYGMEKE